VRNSRWRWRVRTGGCGPPMSAGPPRAGPRVRGQQERRLPDADAGPGGRLCQLRPGAHSRPPRVFARVPARRTGAWPATRMRCACARAARAATAGAVCGEHRLRNSRLLASCVRVCVCVCCSFQTTRATRPFRYSRPFNALAFDVGVRACVCACVRVCVHACAASGDGRARNCHCIFFSEELSLSAIVLIANILYASSMTVYMYVCIYVCMYVCMHVCM